MRPFVAVVLVGSLLLGGCTGPVPQRQAQPEKTQQRQGPGGALVPVPVQVGAGSAAAPFDVPRTLNLPAGWGASVYARIDKARFMTFTPGGELLVSQPSGGKVWLVRGGQVTEFAGGLNMPHDMVFADVGGRTWLFVAEANAVRRYPYTSGDLQAHDGEVVVDGLPDLSTPELRGNYAHVLKNIAVRDGRLYVSVASTCNACVEDTTSDPQRAAIYTYEAGGRNAGRHLVATGIRNAEGLAFRPGTDELWAVVNNRDNILVPDDRDVDGDGVSDKGRKISQFVDEHPVEEFIQVRDGAFFGWPFCNPDNDHGMHDLPFLRDWELNRDGRRADCAKATPIDLGLPAHTAPLGLTFVPALGGAVVPLHGSWNRTKPDGYRVLLVPWTASGPGDPVDLATGWLVGGRSWGRPVDAALAPDGALLVSDDAAGAVYRLTPPAG